MLIPSFTQLCVPMQTITLCTCTLLVHCYISACVSCVPWWWQWLSGVRLLPSTPQCSDTLPPHIPTKGWDGTVTDTGNLLYDRQMDTNAICLFSKESREKSRNKQSNLNLTANTQLFTPASCMQLTVWSFSFRRSLWSLLKFFPTGMSVFSHSGSLSLW